MIFFLKKTCGRSSMLGVLWKVFCVQKTCGWCSIFETLGKIIYKYKACGKSSVWKTCVRSSIFKRLEDDIFFRIPVEIFRIWKAVDLRIIFVFKKICGRSSIYTSLVDGIQFFEVLRMSSIIDLCEVFYFYKTCVWYSFWRRPVEDILSVILKTFGISFSLRRRPVDGIRKLF